MSRDQCSSCDDNERHARETIDGLAAEVETLTAEVARLRGVLANIAHADMRTSTARLHAVSEAVEAVEDVMATSHLPKAGRARAVAALRDLHRMFDAEVSDRSMPGYRAHHAELARDAAAVAAKETAK